MFLPEISQENLNGYLSEYYFVMPLKECSSETLSIFWKTHLWKRNFWNEITEKKIVFYFQPPLLLIFVKMWIPVFTFYFFGW